MMFTVFFFNLRNMFSARQIFFQMDWHCRLYILIWWAVFLHLIHMFFDWSSHFPYCCVNQFLLLPNASMFWLQVVQFSSIATWGINPNTSPFAGSLWKPVSFFGGLSQFPPISSFSLAGVSGLAGLFIVFVVIFFGPPSKAKTAAIHGGCHEVAGIDQWGGSKKKTSWT